MCRASEAALMIFSLVVTRSRHCVEVLWMHVVSDDSGRICSRACVWTCCVNEEWLPGVIVSACRAVLMCGQATPDDIQTSVLVISHGFASGFSSEFVWSDGSWGYADAHECEFSIIYPQAWATTAATYLTLARGFTPYICIKMRFYTLIGNFECWKTDCMVEGRKRGREGECYCHSLVHYRRVLQHAALPVSRILPHICCA